MQEALKTIIPSIEILGLALRVNQVDVHQSELKDWYGNRLNRQNSYSIEVTSSAGLSRMRKWLRSWLFIASPNIEVLDKASTSIRLRPSERLVRTGCL
jgi:hypothetical protein